jgi:hypothetical protein
MEENQNNPEIKAADNPQPVLPTSPPRRNLIS